MNLDVRVEGLLTTAELAGRADFALGRAVVSPSTRTIAGPGGKADLEPRVMQVLVVLADAGGAVVTRKTLFERCWGSPLVTNDSLNRAIGVLRRIAAEVAGGSFAIETIPRTGYRLTREAEATAETTADPPIAETPAGRALSRRTLIGAGAAVAGLGITGIWLARRDLSHPGFDRLMQRGNDALREDDGAAAQYFRQAAALQPGNATAWGLLAYALGSGADNGPAAVTAAGAQAAERAARTALQIDPQEPNALLAMTVIQSKMLDWLAREESYRRVLAIDPRNTLAMGSLGQLLHAVGRCGDSLAMAERMASLEPLWPDLQARKALRLWVVGRTVEADRVCERAMELWPSHRMVRLARLMIYAFTGRAGAALAFIDDEQTRPRLLSPSVASVWRTSLHALRQPTPSNVASARSANLDGSRSTPAVAANAILLLSALGELDSAFEVAEGFLLGRGSVIVRPSAETGAEYVNHWGWRNTFGLFTPPTAAMRLDPRFQPLANGLGLTDYWRKRGIGPDAFLFEA